MIKGHTCAFGLMDNPPTLSQHRGPPAPSILLFTFVHGEIGRKRSTQPLPLLSTKERPLGSREVEDVLAGHVSKVLGRTVVVVATHARGGQRDKGRGG